jgi:hypothetical protein
MKLWSVDNLKKRKKGETSGHLVLQDDEKTMTVFDILLQV